MDEVFFKSGVSTFPKTRMAARVVEAGRRLLWKEILGPMHILVVALIVVGVVLLIVAPST